ncbi:hypothetical protein BJV78DRAFT_1281914 [Lactifluus subvellereus]|nr:hypothetical protein BJV78DRAFT_1281914 [Lactifluus subvellereus]
MVVPDNCTSELWITYRQASRSHKQATAQLIDVGDSTHLIDLEDVLDRVFEQGFVDSKWRSVIWWEDCTSMRLKASTTVQDLLVRGVGSTPETALRLIIVDIPVAIWVHYEYVHCGHQYTATQRFRLEMPDFKCERLAHITNYIFAKGYLPSKTRSLVSWKAASGKVIEESAKVEDVLSWGEGVCEEKPLCLVIVELLRLESADGRTYDATV